MTNSVRPLSADEWPTARDLRIAALTDAPSAFGSTLDREIALTQAEWRARLTGGGWYAAFVGAQAVGLVCCVIDDPAVADLVAMWVAPDYRGTGIADALVRAAVAHARAARASAVRLWVVETNERAIALYERLHFRSTGRRQPLPRDPDVPEIELRLPLA